MVTIIYNMIVTIDYLFYISNTKKEVKMSRIFAELKMIADSLPELSNSEKLTIVGIILKNSDVGRDFDDQIIIYSGLISLDDGNIQEMDPNPNLK